MSYADILKKHGLNKSSDEEDKSGSKSTAVVGIDAIQKKHGLYVDVDDNYINTFIQDSNAFLTQSQTDWENLSWESGSNQESYKKRQSTADDLSFRKYAIRDYLRANKNRLSEDAYNQLTSYIDAVDFSGIANQFSKAYNNYSQYESQEMYDIYQMDIKDIWKKVNSGEGVAYTTKNGQEITWKALYDSKSLDAQKDYYSSLDDWEEKSKGITSTLDMPSDAQTVWQLMFSNTPETWEEAERQGYTKEYYDRHAADRDKNRAYISQKYGVDFNAYDAREQLGRLYNELATKDGEMYTFGYMDDMDEDELAVLTYIFNQ